MRHTQKKVIDRITQEYKLLDKLVSALSEKEWNYLLPRSETKNPWTVKDSLAHITYWKADAIRSIRKQPKPIEHRRLNITDGNHIIYLRWHNKSSKAVLAWHRQVQDDAIATLKEMPKEWFSSRKRSSDWPGDLDGHSTYHRIKDIETVLKSKKK